MTLVDCFDLARREFHACGSRYHPQEEQNQFALTTASLAAASVRHNCHKFYSCVKGEGLRGRICEAAMASHSMLQGSRPPHSRCCAPHAIAPQSHSMLSSASPTLPIPFRRCRPYIRMQRSRRPIRSAAAADPSNSLPHAVGAPSKAAVLRSLLADPDILEVSVAPANVSASSSVLSGVLNQFVKVVCHMCMLVHSLDM